MTAVRKGEKSPDQENEAKPVEATPPPKTQGKQTDALRTCPIVFPSQGGEKIVKMEAIEPLRGDETLEKLKKGRKVKPSETPPPQEEEFEEPEEEPRDNADDAVEEENDDAFFEEEDYEEEVFDTETDDALY